MSEPPPAPWAARRLEGRYWISDANGKKFARVITTPHDAADARLIAAAPAMRDALRGTDPEMPEYIQPLGWLHSMIQDCKDRGPGDEIDDHDAYWEMIREVEQLYENAKAALALAEGADQ